MIKDDNFITIQGWMITRLRLSGTDLIIYAIIYGFSQDESSVFQGTASYLAEWCNCSLRSVQRSIKNLQDLNLIEQAYHSSDNRDVYYRAVTYDKMTQVLTTKCRKPYDKMTQVLTTKCRKPYDKLSQHHNITDNIRDNITDTIEREINREKRSRSEFKIPTLEEVKEYASRNGHVVENPVAFYDYYSANGWKVGSNQMKDWRAAFRTWENRTRKETAEGSRKKSSDIPFMENEYSKEHLKIKEEESDKYLDDLISGDSS